MMSWGSGPEGAWRGWAESDVVMRGGGGHHALVVWGYYSISLYYNTNPPQIRLG